MERFTWSLTFTLGDTIFECGEEEGGKCGGVAENRDEVTPSVTLALAHYLLRVDIPSLLSLSIVDLPFPLVRPGRHILKQYHISINHVQNWVNVRCYSFLLEI
jgi:hypothetical protein